MTTSLIAASLWVLAASLTALLPMRMQYAPGLALLAAAPVLLIWIGRENGPWMVVIALLAVLSLFRRPLAVLLRRALKR